MDKPTVFISYSHKDEEWKDRLRPHLGVLEKEDRITIWDDRQIEPTDEWYQEIKRIMAEATVSICLISSDYLNSDFCVKEEIPDLLVRRKRDGMTLYFILLRPCAWKAVSWLEPRQMLPRDGKSVTVDYKEDWDTVFADVAERIFKILDDPEYTPPTQPASEWPSPEQVDIDRMPVTGAELFGRQKDLVLLDESWDSESTNVVSLVAWGGVGKSTLVNKWLERMGADNYCGARRVYAWSFYSQGTGERVTSADEFMAATLEWFGDPDPKDGSPWSKSERLAELVRKEKTLLVLDGMEPLQSHLEYERGLIKDPALGTLISEFARENLGLCVITTRENVADLKSFEKAIVQTDLEQISDEAGRALLRVRGVRGTDEELEAATREFGNHTLALNLLSVYLHDIPGHHISNASEIPDLDIPVEEGRHPRRVMTAFHRRFGTGPEVELLSRLRKNDSGGSEMPQSVIPRAAMNL
ncbi:MAG: toll/interleukin-1 receptor domain-containing protein, partial [Nitrospinota bacterium]|nr:toll/interleukin-1 receptor domain-containing protein [Nitrospinota bacterium]